MKTIISVFSSARTMLVLLLIFAVSIAIATFIENDFGTDSARKLVYNATWFEVLLALGVINIFGVTVKHRMYTRAKLTVLIFHLALVVILLGAGITRYFGIEGAMHIREGDTSREWITLNSYISVLCRNGSDQSFRSYPVLFASASRNKFKKSMTIDGEKVKLQVREFIPQAKQILKFSREGEASIHLVTTGSTGRTDLFLTRGMSLEGNNLILTYRETNDSISDPKTAVVFDRDGMLFFYAPFSVIRTNMGEAITDTLAAFEEHLFLPVQLHNFNGNLLVVKQFLPSAELVAESADDENTQFPSALKVSVTARGATKSLTLWGSKEQRGQFYFTAFDQLEVGLSYGSIAKELPFSLRLNDFIIKRYPGSESPSWFESNVQLIDVAKNIQREERIYMNHILKHRGFRFYQSSYDQDEKGTVLSLNRDGVGSTISYLGYLLLGLGMFMSLFNKKSRFGLLTRLTGGEAKAVSGLAIVLFFTLTSTQAQDNPDSLPVIKAEHAAMFDTILIQDNGGRIEPLNTLASEILRKVNRSEKFMGQTPNQVILGMMVYPGKWQEVPFIRVNHPLIQEELGISGKYASFLDFFASDMYGGYTLQGFVEQAYRKKPAYRNKFDNEIIRVDERLNICYLVYTNALFKFFPDPADEKNTWHSPLTAPEVFTGEDSVFTRQVLAFYSGEVVKSMISDDWTLPDKLAGAIYTFQTKYGEPVLPDNARIRAEAFYNAANIFERIIPVYFLVGFILLMVQFLHIFFPGFSIKWFSITGLIILAIIFLLHAAGLGLRWYVAGHAPWSNGYEALTFIAWASVLAGIVFSRKSAVTLSSTAILAALILQTAHLSWMDPQITNLVPVLKSYWLVIHVAMITSSYGFLGLGALVAGFNMLLMFFQSGKNRYHLDAHLGKLTHIVEMTLIAGLYLLSIGTFLGGVWANESWGRYWAWDPKETWALITILVYAVILHLRLVPGLKGRLLFNAVSLWAFWSVIMTYFGVNYYLSGLHSYAAGDPLPVPPVIYYTLAIMAVITVLTIVNQYRLDKVSKNIS